MILRRQKGAALLFALAAMMTLIFISVSASREATVEYVVSSNSLNRVRAYYAARAGLEMALLRINIYQQAMQNAPDIIKKQQNLLDLIWTFPVSYPFDETLLANLGAVERDALKKTEKTSLMEGRYYVSIESEDSRLDVNDLASFSKSLRKKTREQLLAIFKNKEVSDEDFAERYRNFDFDSLVNNMTDWVDYDKEGVAGGRESDLYQEKGIDGWPPNQPFKTFDEMRSVSGMNDELFNLLRNQVTVFGIKAINVNQADAVVLQSISPLINAELAAKIIARRNDPTLGPFTNLKEFLDFLSSAEGGSVNVERLTDEAVPLVFEATHNFRITSVGEFGNVRRTITAITMDFDAIRRNLVESFKADNQPQRPEEDGASSPNQAGGANDSLPPSGSAGASQGDKTPRRPPQRPTIVYWHES